MTPLWKLNLYKRDGYCCLKCGCTVDLSIHHLFPQSKYPHLKTNRANLVTLCKCCHAHYHNWFCKRDIEKCNAITFLEWLGSPELPSNYVHAPKYIVKIDKRYKDTFTRIFKDEKDEENLTN